MQIDTIKLAFSFIAGLLTTLSPCVLPVLPFVTASSLNKNKFGPLALAFGLLISFVGVSLLISTSGLIFGVNPSLVRQISGVFLMLSGFLFLSQRLSDWLSAKLSFISGKASHLGQNNSQHSLLTEFLNGLLLGVVWTPCSGPSLGAALGLAAQDGNASGAGVILLIFGLGAVIPLLVFAYGARHFVGQIKTHTRAIQNIKKVFGGLVVIFGFLIVFELD
jgi:cytochrome c-type biogenesis protein